VAQLIKGDLIILQYNWCHCHHHHHHHPNHVQAYLISSIEYIEMASHCADDQQEKYTLSLAQAQNLQINTAPSTGEYCPRNFLLN
jgi:hypothetical protein